MSPSVENQISLTPDHVPQKIQLENGERSDQRTFHAWYKATPRGFKAELIGGEVVAASPLKVIHAEHHALTMLWLGHYSLETPGTRLWDNATVILGKDCEVQPDSTMIIEPSRGGQTRVDEEGYATGAPEIICEIANSSGAIDLHRKKRDYERAGVREYSVVLLREQQVRWFVLRDGLYQDLPPGSDGIYRSLVFPGLSLDPAALVRLDSAGLLAVLRVGLAAPEHGGFVRALAERR